MARRRVRRRIPPGAAWDLKYGPWGLTDDGESRWGSDDETISPPAFASDHEAERAFRALEPTVDDGWWAYWRFVRGLGPSQAFAAVWAVRKRKQAASHRRTAEKTAMPEWAYVKQMLAHADELEREADELEAASHG